MSLKDLKKELEKDKVPVIIGADRKVEEFVSTGVPVLDWCVSGKLVGGGLPVGRVVELFGDPSTGKSLLLVHILAEIQKKGGIAILDDVEAAFDADFAAKVGLNVNEVLVMESDTTEEHFRNVSKVIDKIRATGFDGIIGIALDSLAALSTKHEQQAGFEKPDLSKAKVVRQSMRLLARKFSRDRVLYVVCNQTIESIDISPGGFRSPRSSFSGIKDTPGGGGIKFQSSVRIQLTPRSILKDKAGVPIGVSSRVVVVKNKVAPPFREMELLVRFDTGADPKSGLVDLAVKLGWVENKGAGWYVYKNKSYRREDLEKVLLEEVSKKEVADESFNLGAGGDEGSNSQ